MRRDARHLAALTLLLLAGPAAAQPAEEERGLQTDRELEREEGAERRRWQREWYGEEWSPDYREQLYDAGVFQRMVFAHKFRLAPSMRAATRIPAAAPGSKWVNLGPAAGTVDYDVTEGGTQRRLSLSATDSGRVNEIAVHPWEPNTVFVVSAEGGLWQTKDGGQTWKPKTENEPTLALSSIAIDPHTPTTLYLGLGDSKEASFGGTGVGVIKSADGGETWSAPVALRSSSVETTRNSRVVSTLLVDPASPDVVLAGTDRGLFRSSDAGESFQPVTFPAGFPQAIEDVTWTGGDRFVLAAGHTWLDPNGGAVLLVSSDRGRTWRLPAGLGDPSDFLAFAVAAAPSDRRRLYALASRVDLDLGEIFTSTDGGETWTAIQARTLSYANGTTERPGLSVLLGGQGGYNQLVIVDPGDPQTVYFGGADHLVKTTDGGATFSILSHWRGETGLPYLHSDFQCAVFDGRGGLWLGTDGGVARSTDGGVTWSTAENRGLSTHLVYNVSSSPAAQDVVVAGLQDNGTRVRIGATAEFTQRAYADGFGVLVHPHDANRILSSVYYTRILKSLDRGVSYRAIYADILEAGQRYEAPFLTQIVPSPADATGDTVLTFTNRAVYRSKNFGETWKRLPVAGLARDIRNLAVARSDGDRLGLIVKGGEILLSENGGVTWTAAAGSLPNHASRLSHIAFNPLDGDTIYIASVAPVKTASHLWKSTDRGKTWTAIDTAANFPRGVPVNIVVGDPGDVNTLYAGTHLGLYKSVDAGQNWTRFGSGLPLVSVTDVYVSPDSSQLRIGTYGRGVWELTP